MKRVLNWGEDFLVSPVLLYRYLRFGKIYRRIYLGEGQWTILESPDYYRLKNFRWFVFVSSGKFYAHRCAIIKNQRTKRISMHREIMNAPKSKLVDHKNGDSLDNLRSNLRLATQRENLRNRKKTKSKTSSLFRGIYRYRKYRWVALIKYRGKRIWLGIFDNEIDAAKAYDKAAKKYFGQFARLNFPAPPADWQGLDYQVAKLMTRFRLWMARVKKICKQILARIVAAKMHKRAQNVLPQRAPRPQIFCIATKRHERAQTLINTDWRRFKDAVSRKH